MRTDWTFTTTPRPPCKVASFQQCNLRWSTERQKRRQRWRQPQRQRHAPGDQSGAVRDVQRGACCKNDDVVDHVVVAKHLDRGAGVPGGERLLGVVVDGAEPGLVHHDLVAAVQLQAARLEVDEEQLRKRWGNVRDMLQVAATAGSAAAAHVGAEVAAHRAVDAHAVGHPRPVEHQVLHGDVLVAALLPRVRELARCLGAADLDQETADGERWRRADRATDHLEVADAARDRERAGEQVLAALQADGHAAEVADPLPHPAGAVAAADRVLHGGIEGRRRVRFARRVGAEVHHVHRRHGRRRRDCRAAVRRRVPLQEARER